ncbi:MAG: DUF4384 domain-containing protein [Planctomycetota bacterium]
MRQPLARQSGGPGAAFVWIVWLASLLVACEAVPEVLRWTAGFAGNLLSAAAGNYSPSYAEKVDRLLAGIAQPETEVVNDSQESPLQLDIALLRQTKGPAGNTTLEPIKDGDVLRDGRGDPEAGDRFRIVLRANLDCHVYVVGIDATGWVSPLFPGQHSSHQNPVAKDRSYEIPDEAWAFSLDENRGIEHVYFVASREPCAAVEAILREFERVRPVLATVSALVTEPAVVQRGVDKIQTGSAILLQALSGQKEITPVSFLATAAGADLVVTRWFRHE